MNPDIREAVAVNARIGRPFPRKYFLRLQKELPNEHSLIVGNLRRASMSPDFRLDELSERIKQYGETALLAFWAYTGQENPLSRTNFDAMVRSSRDLYNRAFAKDLEAFSRQPFGTYVPSDDDLIFA